MKSWMIGLFFSLPFAPYVLANPSNYSMADLEILASNGPYPEFFEHLYDIKPSERDKNWQELAKSTSEKYVKYLHSNKLFGLDSWKIVRELSTKNYNQANDGLKLVRNKYGEEVLDFCFKTNNFKNCYPIALEILGDQSDPQLAHDLGRVIQRYHPKEASHSEELLQNVWPFYRIMAAHPLSEFYCDRTYFQDIVLGQLHQKIANLSGAKLSEAVFQVMHNDCWDKITVELKKDMAKNFTSLLNYKLLVATRKIDQKDLLTFKIVYLLQTTSDGPLLDESFQALLSLRENFEQRQMVLDQLKQIDPLPGRIFTKTNDRRALVVVKNLSQFFPEYVDFYATTCLDYLSGSVKFPKGNPTTECNELFEVSEKINVLPDMVLKRYKQIRNFKNI